MSVDDDRPAGSACVRWLLRLRVFLVIAFVQSVFAGYAVISKATLTHGFDAGVFTLMRDVSAGAILLSVGRARAGKWLWPNPEDRFTFVLLGITNVYFGQYCFIVGIKYTTAVTATLWANMLPVSAYLWGLLLGTERVTRHLHTALKLAGLFFAVGGQISSTVLKYESSGSSDGSGSSSSGSGPGENLALGTCFFFSQTVFGSYFFFLQKKLLQKYSPLHVTAWGYSYGAVLMLLVVVPQALSADMWDLSGLDAIAVAYSAVIQSSLGYFLLTWANRQTNPVIVTLFGPLQIIVACLLRLFIYGTTPALGDVVGGAAVVVGLVFIVSGRLKEEEAVRAGVAEDLYAAPSDRAGSPASGSGATCDAEEACAAPGDPLLGPDAGAAAGGTGDTDAEGEARGIQQ